MTLKPYRSLLLNQTSLLVAKPSDLGFVPAECSDDRAAWTQRFSGRGFHFRLLQSLDDLASAEDLQREVLKVSDRDLASASTLIGAAETGGLILAAESEVNSNDVAGVSISFGGFVDGVPVLCSDMLMVRSVFRGTGVGTALKRLQAALAIERGFHAIIWTVDPLRASNARLNFEKLGAFSARYERNRYGSLFGSGLYGGLPSDRLHLIWPILSPLVQTRLRPTESARVRYDQSFKRIPIPGDIDTLVQHDFDAAFEWRLATRDAIENAIAEGFVVAGFESQNQGGTPALILRSDLDTYLMSDDRIAE